jgi:hypothetical protein
VEQADNGAIKQEPTGDELIENLLDAATAVREIALTGVANAKAETEEGSATPHQAGTNR